MFRAKIELADSMQSRTRRESIEYLYGPFDGHVEYTRTQCDEFPKELLCLVNENAFRLIENQMPVPHVACNSIAIYERVKRNKSWFYLFRGAIPTKEITRVCADVGLRFGAVEQIDCD
jgi:hypothetical protein